ncbi:MAG: reverse gyrase [Desulfurococcales archaeon]|nr:reverse gyrase [Desulfurococcales archaeon]
MDYIRPVFRGMCPNCGGPIEASRLSKGLPCSRCLPREVDGGVWAIAEALRSNGSLEGYSWLYALEREYRSFEEYFESKLGVKPWSAQRSWARRLLLGESLAIIAPTGVGKSTLLSVYASYRVENSGWRVLYLSPTENLVRQTSSRLESLLGDGVAYYYSSMGKRIRSDALDRISRGDYRVAVVTTGFLQRRFELLEASAPFNLVIVDDVDSVLRNSRNVDRILALMGYSSEITSAAYSLVESRIKLYKALASGRERAAEKLKDKIAGYEAILRSYAPSIFSQLVIASATGRPRGVKHLVFKELLGFEVGGGSDYMRNVVDSYLISEDPMEGVVRVVERLGPGGVVFVSQIHGKALARLAVEKLSQAGVRVGQAITSSRMAVEKLARGEVDVIVGIASRYGVVVRGLDLPERIRYAVFLGVPGMRVRAGEALLSPRRLLRLLLYMSEAGDGVAGEYASRLRTYMEKIGDDRLISLAARGRISAEGLLGEASSLLSEAVGHALAWLEGETIRGPVAVGSIVYERMGDEVYAVVPDAPTYLQASGRTSRLYKGVMTLGISVVVDSVIERVKALEERLSWYTSSRLLEFEALDLDEVLRRVEASRRGEGKRVNVKSVLLVVESPTKARTISWFWGRPSKRVDGYGRIYETSMVDEETGTVYLLSITASRGHVFDLAIDEEESVYGVKAGGGYTPVYDTIKRCLACGYTYAGRKPCPRCGSTMVLDSKSSISRLRKLALEVDEILIATDPDREGEKIAWDIYLALKPYNRNIYRVKFHEVTRQAVMEALRSPGGVDEHQVLAQIVRRITDRWIGFSLSSHLWSKYGKRWLGAGRVQTPVLGWIIGRYEEWRRDRGYTVYLVLDNGWGIKVFTDSKDEAEKLSRVDQVQLRGLELRVEDRSPPPPFTTDSLIYEASSRLRLSAGSVMRLAQDLFESGLITYHRTDSTRVSSTGMAIAREYLDRHGLSRYYRPRSWGEGGAHEAIRPTRPLDAGELERALLDGSVRAPIKLTRLHLRLYDLIFQRFIASQMSGARIERGRLYWDVAGVGVVEEVNVSLVEDGFYSVMRPQLAEWVKDARPGSTYRVSTSRIYRSSRTPLYRSGDIVRLMREHGIGRPSTYSKAIEANRRHGYIVESRRMKYLIPTRTGIEVYEYLSTHHRDLVSLDTSRRLEEDLDRVERNPSAAMLVLDSLLNRIQGITGIHVGASEAEEAA